MGVGEWLLAGLVALAFAFVILRPDLWGRRGRDNGSSGDGGTAVGVSMDGRHRSDDDADADGEGGGGDGGGGGD